MPETVVRDYILYRAQREKKKSQVSAYWRVYKGRWLTIINGIALRARKKKENHHSYRDSKNTAVGRSTFWITLFVDLKNKLSFIPGPWQIIYYTLGWMVPMLRTNHILCSMAWWWRAWHLTSHEIYSFYGYGVTFIIATKYNAASLSKG
jgi:hypothetical protein